MSHSFQSEEVYFPCNEVGCLTGEFSDPARCACGEVNLMRDLPCNGSKKCAWAYNLCECGKYCETVSAPCTDKQECKLAVIKQK